MPTVFINPRDRCGIDLHVVGQKYRSLAGFAINEFNSTLGNRPDTEVWQLVEHSRKTSYRL